MSKKVYLTVVPLGSNIRLSAPIAGFPVECHGFSMKLHGDIAFPISELMASTVQPEDDAMVICIRQTNDDPFADANYTLLEKEIKGIFPTAKLISICMEETQNPDNLFNLLTDLLQVFPEECRCYADLTFGSKPMSLVLFQFLNCIHQLSNSVEITKLIYREVQRHWNPEMRCSVDDAWIYHDITALFHLGSIAALTSGSGNRELLLTLLKN